MPPMQQAFIIAMCRSAFTKAKKGGLRFTRSDDFAAHIVKSLIHKIPGIENYVDDLIVGCANPEGEQGLQIGRQIALKALGIKLPGMTVNRYCASGLEALAIATAKIRSGMGHCYIAGGVESMSLIPMEGYKLAPNYELALEHPDYLVGMGLTAEAVAQKYKISREDQDAFALQSHANAAAAQDAGIFDREIEAVIVEEKIFKEGTLSSKQTRIDKDEGIRRDTNHASLAALKPAFAKNGSVTAGNSSQTTDGAAFLLVVSEELLQKLNLQALGRLISCSIAAVDPLYMGIGPCFAIPKALEQAGLKLSELDLIELNEAFASQCLAVIRETGLNPAIVNVNGGAIALGHPLGCSGARLAMTALNELQRRKQKYGLVTACVGGGQGIAAVLERL